MFGIYHAYTWCISGICQVFLLWSFEGESCFPKHFWPQHWIVLSHGLGLQHWITHKFMKLKFQYTLYIHGIYQVYTASRNIHVSVGSLLWWRYSRRFSQFASFGRKHSSAREVWDSCHLFRPDGSPEVLSTPLLGYCSHVCLFSIFRLILLLWLFSYFEWADFFCF